MTSKEILPKSLEQPSQFAPEQDTPKTKAAYPRLSTSDSLQKMQRNSGAIKPHEVFHLQRTIGNRALQKFLIARASKERAASAETVPTKAQIQTTAPTGLLQLTRWEWQQKKGWVDIAGTNLNVPNKPGKVGQIYDDVREMLFIQQPDGFYYLCTDTMQYCTRDGWYVDATGTFYWYDILTDYYYNPQNQANYIYRPNTRTYNYIGKQTQTPAEPQTLGTQQSTEEKQPAEEKQPTEEPLSIEQQMLLAQEMLVQEDQSNEREQDQTAKFVQSLPTYQTIEAKLNSIGVQIKLEFVREFSNRNKFGDTELWLEHTDGKMQPAALFPDKWETVKPDGAVIIVIRLKSALAKAQLMETIAHEVAVHGEPFTEFLTKNRTKLNEAGGEYIVSTAGHLGAEAQHDELVTNNEGRMYEIYLDLQKKDEKMAKAFYQAWHYDRKNHAREFGYTVDEISGDKGRLIVIKNKEGDVKAKYEVPW